MIKNKVIVIFTEISMPDSSASIPGHYLGYIIVNDKYVICSHYNDILNDKLADTACKMLDPALKGKMIMKRTLRLPKEPDFAELNCTVKAGLIECSTMSECREEKLGVYCWIDGKESHHY